MKALFLCLGILVVCRDNIQLWFPKATKVTISADNQFLIVKDESEHRYATVVIQNMIGFKELPSYYGLPNGYFDEDGK